MVSSERRNNTLFNIGLVAKEASLSMKTFSDYDRIRLFCKSGQTVSSQPHFTYLYQNKRYPGSHLKEIVIRKLDKVYIQISDIVPFQYKPGSFSNLSNVKNWLECLTIINSLKQLQRFF
jgi:hypothetical protein